MQRAATELEDSIGGMGVAGERVPGEGRRAPRRLDAKRITTKETGDTEKIFTTEAQRNEGAAGRKKAPAVARLWRGKQKAQKQNRGDPPSLRFGGASSHRVLPLFPRDPIRGFAAYLRGE